MILVAAGNSSTGYTINKSLRFRASATAYLNRTLGTATNSLKWTYSAWVKRSDIGSFGNLLYCGDATTGNDELSFYFRNGDQLAVYGTAAGASRVSVQTNAVFRDPSAWYHIVIAYDSTQATAANRILLYVNNVLQTISGTPTYPALNQSNFINTSTYPTYIGRQAFDTSANFDGYLAEVNFVDGQALTPSYFGNINPNTNVWQPAKYLGLYGTNGFYLKFTDTTSTATLGNDFSGNSNTFTTNNISLTSGSTYDSMNDSPTLTSATVANYAVMNPLNTANTLSNANLTASTATVAWYPCVGTIGVSSKKWYWEIVYSGTFTLGMVGIGSTNFIPAVNVYPGITSDSYGYFSSNGNKYNNGANSAYGASYTTGDIIGIALDMDAGALTFYKNNVSQGVAFTGLSGTFFPAFGAHNSTVNVNFGQQPFAYTPPTGYNALNTFNLPNSAVLIGNKVMDATLYTATGTTPQTVTNAGVFKPDLVWTKNRSSTGNHYLNDSVRGAANELNSNTTSTETADAAYITSFNTNGYGIGTNNFTSGQNIVGWQWQAGQGTTSSNTSGNVTSTVSVNPTAGFSVVTYTVTTTPSMTIGHGLGVAPQLIIEKARNTVSNWDVYHVSVGNTGRLQLNLSDAFQTQAGVWNNTTPTSTVFSQQGNGTWHAVGTNCVAYCWAPIPGFSAFGSYTGNGSTNGPFIYTGFRPKWVMIKNTTTVAGWLMYDSVRNTYNIENLFLQANTGNAEATFDMFDFLSNGFKLRTTDNSGNTSGNVYIYMAFAENPFKNALAR